MPSGLRAAFSSADLMREGENQDIIMERKTRFRGWIDAAGKGLEIGPSHSPIAPKSEGFDVDVIDHCGREELVEKYRPHGVDLGAIEEVDFVWKGSSYAELVGATSCYDWIIASHVIEHAPDLICFLKDADELLRDTGVLVLAVPDKRYCFDRFRPITGLAALIDAHLRKDRVHTPGRVAEYFLNVVAMSGRIAWDEGQRRQDGSDTFSFVHDAKDAKSGMAGAQQGAYLDVHAWCFTPTSFRLLIEDLFVLGFSHLREAEFYSGGGGEFFMVLSRAGAGPKLSRAALLDQIDQEHIDVVEQERRQRPLLQVESCDL